MINWKAAVVGATAIALASGAAEAREIKVGFIATFSGPVAQLGDLLR
ncbi:MAG: hypothetical protein RLT05_26400 [Bauldia litoralis]